jgi:hypothetical protein
MSDESRLELENLAAGMRLGLVSAGTVAAVLALAGSLENGDPWGPFNDVSHILLGEQASQIEGFEPQVTLTGVALHAVSLAGWGVLYRILAGRPRFPGALAAAAGAGLATYFLDYHVFPQRLRPGFERRLSRKSILFAYLVLSLTFLGADRS